MKICDYALVRSLVLGFQDSKQWMQGWKSWDELKLNGNLNGRWAQCHDCDMGVATLNFEPLN